MAQQAFILNATVRDNILFGCKYDKKRYNIIVNACALTKDFEILPKGDKSQIGEKVMDSQFSAQAVQFHHYYCTYETGKTYICIYRYLYLSHHLSH